MLSPGRWLWRPHVNVKSALATEGPSAHRTLGPGGSLCFRDEDTGVQKGVTTCPGLPSTSEASALRLSSVAWHGTQDNCQVNPACVAVWGLWKAEGVSCMMLRDTSWTFAVVPSLQPLPFLSTVSTLHELSHDQPPNSTSSSANFWLPDYPTTPMLPCSPSYCTKLLTGEGEW